MSEHPQNHKIHAIEALSFTANGEYLVGGGCGGVQVWRVHDSARVATMEMGHGVLCIAVSADGKYIAAGSIGGEVWVWDANNYKQVFAVNIDSIPYDVDFSSDRLVFPYRDTATIWDVTARKKVHTLDHGGRVMAAKCSPQGDRIATGSEQSIRVWDSNSGRFLVVCKGKVDLACGLLWFNNHLFVRTEDRKIKEIDASIGSTISEWSVPGAADDHAYIALPQHGKYIAYSSSDCITFQDISTYTRLASIPRSGESRSISFSPDDRLLAIVDEREIVFKSSSFLMGPEIYIDSAALDAWKHGQLVDAESLLSAAIPISKDTAHHILACRALVRARLQQWGAALVDAEESIKIQSSVVGYIAKYAVLVGKGEKHKGCRVCDIAFHLHSDHATILLLIKALVLFMAGDHEDAISRVDDLIATVGINSTLYVVQAYMYLLLGSLHLQSGDYKRAIWSLERAQARLGKRTDQPPPIISLVSGWNFEDFAITIRQRLSEALLSAGRVEEASEYVLRMMGQAVNMTEPIKSWVSDIVQRCLSTRQIDENVRGEAVRVSHVMMSLSRAWAESRLTDGTWEDAIIAATGVVVPRFTIYQVVCERLEMTGRVAEAVSCLGQLCSEPAQGVDGENWIQDFKSRCCAKLEALGDAFLDAQDYDEAISQYTTALSLDPTITTLRDLLGKRSKARASKGEWENTLNDANEMIKLDPLSPFGYENKHQALRGARYFAGAIDVFETMLSKISGSSDPVVREQTHRFVKPEQTKEAIREAIKSAIRDSPAVLISAISGRLCDKIEQAAAFESMPIFTELVASMTTHIDYELIRREVGEFYRYATFSHTWEGKEPLFDKVTKILVYNLEASPTHEKLQIFCKIVRDAGFNWAWSDTCCINKGDHVVLQEALVSMFKWYEGSALTIIFLRGVGRLAPRGAMMRSIWNSRGWTLQEYHASKVVRFYTEDWTPYLDLKIHNHKDSLEIISEMEEATRISTQVLTALRPGLDDIREKLCLASTRETSRVEDAAYSLLGIFSLSLPVTYGEGDRALSRLLAQLLTSSGDTSILAWTGQSGDFNSCLPSSIAVFRDPPTSYIPLAIPDADIGAVRAGLHSVNFLDMATRLYDRLYGLSVPTFTERRMRLPCLTFKLGRPVSDPLTNGLERVFRAEAAALGIIEIRTREDLSQLRSLHLIHPWIGFLLSREPVVETIIEDQQLPSIPLLINTTSANRQTLKAGLFSRLGHPFSSHPPPESKWPHPPSILTPAEKHIRVLQFLSRLRQQFGALLLSRTHQNMEQYKRVAPESLITVRVQELTPAVLDRLIQDVRVLDVL